MYDVIVVGGGHAGIEAALACARLNKKTALVTMNKNYVGSMPCNPSVGGPAKGVVVREIDALGGQMGKTADKTALQFKMLNTTKGPGVQCVRVQSDKVEYSKYMLEVLEQQANLEIVEELVIGLLHQDNVITGVKTENGEMFSKITILTTGTFMGSKIMVSSDVHSSGPDNQRTTSLLTKSLNDLGIKTFRLKTGTPARIKTSTIDFSKTEIQHPTNDFICYSYETKQILPYEKQLPCYLTYTTDLTLQLIRENLTKSSMYSGVVKGVGPRYCPSIEDKVVRFSDKERHQIFLEPESLSLPTTYIQGFSTSLPYDVQDKMLRSLPGLENCEVVKYAYAIEYDAIDPLQLLMSLELIKYPNLFTAGQINGTSGYEEAAAQGLMAGINACLKLDGKNPLILKRDEAYIGVMIDDLVTKGTNEPYRLLTSRAEYRLLLRHDNADQRLTPYGYALGLISESRYKNYLNKLSDIKLLAEELRNIKINGGSPINEYVKEIDGIGLNNGISGIELLKRPHIDILKMNEYLNLNYSKEVLNDLSVEVKYSGYIEKAKREASKMHKLDDVVIPLDFNYDDVAHLALEARSKLEKIRPHTIGQASRISGVNPSDVAILLMYIK
ncbi:MAG: tRNA uridine-5-carboxymethylaminomethyl(34) synthesis enzyme MnmG [Erysipelotrichaceae bacterium]